MTPLFTLRRARDIVANGWTQNAFGRDEFGDECTAGGPKVVSCCLYGALNRALPKTKNDGPQFEQLVEIVAGAIVQAQPEWGRHIGNPHVLMLRWNDTPGRTQEEVLMVLDYAIDVLTLEEA